MNRFTENKENPEGQHIIKNLEEVPLLSFNETLQPLISIIDDLDDHASQALQVAQILNTQYTHLSPDFIATLNLYTQEWPSSSSSLYYVLNQRLRSTDVSQLQPFLLYIRSLVEAMSKLPKHDGDARRVWRGVRGVNLKDSYRTGDTVVWPGMSSCTLNMASLEQFLGSDGERTLFNVHCKSGVDIHMFSTYQSESEVLLSPCCLLVIGIINASDGLLIVELKEINSLFITKKQKQTEKQNENEKQNEKEKQTEKKQKQNETKKQNDPDFQVSKNFYTPSIMAPHSEPVQRDRKILKMIIIGSTSVGKSNILYQWVNHRHNSESNATMPVDFNASNVDDWRVQVWDTMGLKSYRGLILGYYRGADCVLVVYDITSRSSFHDLPYWLIEAKTSAPPHAVIMIIGNKRDCEGKREVSTEEGLEVARAHGVMFCEVSAKTGEGIDDLFEKLARRFISMVNIMEDSSIIRLEENQGKNKEDTCCA